MARRQTRLNASTSSSIDFAENIPNLVHSPTRSSKSTFTSTLQRWYRRSVSSSIKFKLLMIGFLVVSVVVITQVRNPEEHEQQTNNILLDNTELLNALYELPLPKTKLELDQVNDELKELYVLTS